MYNNIDTAMTNVLMNNDIFNTQSHLVSSFASIAEERSGRDSGHVMRVAEYMRILVYNAGHSSQRCDVIYIASMLHDIGKLSVPNELLQKPSPSPSEKEIIKNHVIYGKELRQNCPGDIM